MLKVYDNCTELKQDYPYGVVYPHWAYAGHLDRDHDGYACEVSGHEGEAAQPTPTPTKTTVSPTPSVSVSPSKTAPTVSKSPSKTATASPSPTKTATATATPAPGGGDNLPLTGPGEVTAIGGGVILLGVLVVVAFRRRKLRFSA